MKLFITLIVAFVIYTGLSSAATYTSPKTGQVFTYTLGPGGRTNKVSVRVCPKDIGKGSGTTTGTRKHAQQLGKPSDVAGHIIASNLGGPGDQNFNIMPQNAKINNGDWKREEGLIKSYVNTGGCGVYTVTPVYQGSATRPYQINYEFHSPKSAHNGAVLNPV